MDGTDKILHDNNNFHINWLAKTIERLRERRSNGERDITVSIDQMEYMLCETIGLHQRLTMMEKYALSGVYAPHRTGFSIRSSTSAAKISPNFGFGGEYCD